MANIPCIKRGATSSGGKKLELLGVSIEKGTKTINITATVPNYAELTISDFFIEYVASGFQTNEASLSNLNGGRFTCGFGKSYNATTGILTISMSSQQMGAYGSGTVWMWATVNIYILKNV